MKATIKDLTDEQFTEWAKLMIDEAGRRKIPIKGTSKIHPKRISKGNVGALVIMRRAVGQLGRNDIHIAKDIDLTYSERANFSTLRQHGLVAHIKNEKGQVQSGRWLITKRGAQFLRGDIAIPQRVMVMNNRVIERDPVQVTISEVVKQLPVFDDVWDYRANMDTGAVPGQQQSLI